MDCNNRHYQRVETKSDQPSKTMLSKFSPAQWLPNLWCTLSRFPIPVLCAFLFSGGTHLLAESREWNRPKNINLALGVALLTALAGYAHKWLQIEFGFLICTAMLWVMVAGYLRSDVPFGNFWQFNARLCKLA